MYFRKEKFTEVIILKRYSSDILSDDIKELAKDNIIVDLQFTGDGKNTFNALILYRKK